MSIETYKLELKIDTSNEGHEAITAIFAQYARDLLSSAALVAGDKQPQIALTAADSFYDEREIKLMSVDPDEED